jgi:glycosyltransferase involved in cell wall biosynthesis
VLRILQIIPAYYPAVRYGGPIRSVHGLAAALARRGHDVHVYTTSVDGDADLDVPIDRPVMMDGVTVRYFRVPALRRLCWSPGMAARLRKSVGDFDVVNLQSVYLWPTWAGARAAERKSVPFVISPRGMLVGELIRRRSRWVKSAWIHLIEQRSLAAAGGLHVTTDREGEDVGALGLRLPPIFCVPNGITAPERPVPLRDGPFADLPTPYALILGRLNWKKGIDRLIAAWKWVPDLRLVVAGNDEQGYAATLRELTRREGVADRVHFIGEAADEHKWALYQNAEMFILPSYSENFGNVVAEAMAMACPVIVTPEVGLAALVRETQSGLITDGEPERLAATVRCMHAGSALRKELGANGRRAVAERLSWSAVAAQMESVYRKVGASGRRDMLRDATALPTGEAHE